MKKKNRTNVAMYLSRIDIDIVEYLDVDVDIVNGEYLKNVKNYLIWKE